MMSGGSSHDDHHTSGGGNGSSTKEQEMTEGRSGGGGGVDADVGAGSDHGSDAGASSSGGEAPASAVKRKYSDRGEPDSPRPVERSAAYASHDPKKKQQHQQSHQQPQPLGSPYYDSGDDAGSPVAAYPKHVIVPASAGAPGSDKPGDVDLLYNPSVTHSPEDPRNTQLASYSDHTKAGSGNDHHNAGSAVQVLTPDSSNRGRPSTGSYDSHHPLSYHGSGGGVVSGRGQHHHHHQQQHGGGYGQDVYRSPSYNPEMEYGSRAGSYGGPPLAAVGGPPDSSYVRTRRWACDICNVATFASYEEACAHEEICSRRYHGGGGGGVDTTPQQPYYGGGSSSAHPAAAVVPPAHHHHQQHHRGSIAPQGSGLGALYHASQEVVTPPTPHRHSTQRWGAHQGPPLPVFPHEQGYYGGGGGRSSSSGGGGGYHDVGRDDPSQYYEPHAYQSQPPHTPMISHPYSPMHHPPPHQQPSPQQHVSPPHHHHQGGGPMYDYQKRMLLAMPSDRDSLSDRQCYVRSEMVEIFAATDKDVASRHSKGAQKLVIGQVGIRCVHCSHLRPRDRAERAVCYPSSISRIYQTVADMQRFHFEQCREIPEHVRQIYKKLKTTRPRGVGSPQTYWMSSAKQMGLADTECGIRFEHGDMSKAEHHISVSEMSIGTN